MRALPAREGDVAGRGGAAVHVGGVLMSAAANHAVLAASHPLAASHSPPLSPHPQGHCHHGQGAGVGRRLPRQPVHRQPSATHISSSGRRLCLHPPGTATAGGGPALAAAYHASLEASAAESFGGAVINCMCGSSGDDSVV